MKYYVCANMDGIGKVVFHEVPSEKDALELKKKYEGGFIQTSEELGDLPWYKYLPPMSSGKRKNHDKGNRKERHRRQNRALHQD